MDVVEPHKKLGAGVYYSGTSHTGHLLTYKTRKADNEKRDNSYTGHFVRCTKPDEFVKMYAGQNVRYARQNVIFYKFM